jgi:hypothetical protein
VQKERTAEILNSDFNHIGVRNFIPIGAPFTLLRNHHFPGSIESAPQTAVAAAKGPERAWIILIEKNSIPPLGTVTFLSR